MKLTPASLALMLTQAVTALDESPASDPTV